MKKISTFLLLACLTGSLLVPSVVAPSSAYADDKINVEINGDVLQTEQEPFVHNSRTFVPLRSIFEAIGASIDWNETTRTVTASKGDVTVKLTLGSNIAYRNDAPIELDAAPMVRDNRSYVPVRFIAESFHTPVKWVSDTKTVQLLGDNRAKLEQILSQSMWKIPNSFHLDYVGSTTSPQNKPEFTGTRTANIDYSYDPETTSYNYRGIWKQTGELFRSVSDFDLYVTSGRAYVKQASWPDWQTTNLTNASNIVNDFIARANLPLRAVPVCYSKYAVLEETETENVVTFYLPVDTYRQLQPERSFANEPAELKKVNLKYHINKVTNNLNKFEMWHTRKFPESDEFVLHEVFSYSKTGEPYTVTLPQGAHQAKESDLTLLF